MVVAVVLLAACVIVAGVLIQHLTGTSEFVSYDRIVARLHEVTWDNRWVAVVGVILVATGLVLLTLAILPGRPIILPLTDDDGFTAGVARRGLRSALQDAAQSVDGVRSARVRLRHKKVSVKIHTDSVHATGLTDHVYAVVNDRVASIGPTPTPRVVITTHSGRGPKTSADVQPASGGQRVVGSRG